MNTTDHRTLAFSYVRFSTPEQQRGDSYRRQSEAAQRYAERHGLALDERAYTDLGVSAYRGKNAREGSLRTFLDAVEAGDIPRGSVLLVESMDRLSRSIPRKAVRLLEEICEAGVVVVTLDDGQRYDTARLDREPMCFMVAYLVAIRANEESYKKGQRVGEAWAAKRRRAADEKLTAICPYWLSLNEDRAGFTILEDRAEIVRRIYQQFLDGAGQEAIARSLNADGVPTFGRGDRWHKSTIAKILRNAAVVGTYQPHRMADDGSGKRKRIPDGAPVEGYYPSVVDPQVFATVQNRLDGTRATYRREGNAITNPLAGLSRCGDCGATMTRVQKGSRSAPRLVCSRAKVSAGCKYRSIPLSEVIDALTDDDAAWVDEAPSGNEASRQEWASLEAERAGSEEAVYRLAQELARGGASIAIADALRREEANLRALEETTRALSERLARETPNMLAGRLAALKAALQADPLEAGVVNARLRETLEYVTVWPRDEEAGRASSLTFHWLQGGETDMPIGGFGRVS
ncbi:MAG: recombinase family protein [Aquamicrobium sp.]|uniref:recombinase family protein n=1 Tax=Aquamicrobium sp. TaxID=1872579 RepID=UPI00349E9A9F|nr:recombinase family protein [Aquamicrobium sp.]